MTETLTAIFGEPYGVVLTQLIAATRFTIYLSLIAFIGGGIVGAGITFLRILRNPICRRGAIAYIWIFQSTPLLMLLFITGLGVPQILAIRVDPWWAASVSLTLYASAYLSDIWRGAIEAVPKGQWEGGRALALSFPTILTGIVLPQALASALAPTVGMMVQIIKGTSLAYIIGFTDLMAVGKRWANASVDGTDAFLIYPLMAALYFALCFPLSVWARRLEARSGGKGASKAMPAAG